ncbi:MAG: radical SAM protein [Bacteroidota bacterium]
MRILLVKPHLSRATHAGKDFVELEPLELEYLAAALSNHDVELLDMRFERNLEKKIEEFQPHIVGTTAYSVHFYNALKVMQTAKRIDKDIFTVVGGHHATLMSQDFNHKEIDAIVIGEGIFSFKELVENLERRRSLRNIPGLALRENSDLVFTEPRNDIDNVDLFPLPNRDITRKYRQNYFYLWWKPVALMRASVGCAYRCSFCPIWKAARGRWKCRAPELVAEELATVKEGFVYFCDDNAFFDKEKMEALYNFIKQRNIRKEYFFFSRTDTLVKHQDLIEKWAEIGLRQVFLGIEAVTNENLNLLRKRIDSEISREAVRILQRNGIDPFVGFIVFPDFQEKDFDRIYDYMGELGIYYNEITVLTPSPGSDLYWKEEETLTTKNYELFDFLHAVLPTKLNRRDFYRNLANLYIRAYSPLRAFRSKPRTGFPLRPWHLTKALVNAVRNYLSIRNSYRLAARVAKV